MALAFGEFDLLRQSRPARRAPPDRQNPASFHRWMRPSLSPETARLRPWRRHATCATSYLIHARRTREDRSHGLAARGNGGPRRFRSKSTRDPMECLPAAWKLRKPKEGLLPPCVVAVAAWALTLRARKLDKPAAPAPYSPRILTPNQEIAGPKKAGAMRRLMGQFAAPCPAGFVRSKHGQSLIGCRQRGHRTIRNKYAPRAGTAACRTPRFPPGRAGIA